MLVLKLTALDNSLESHLYDSIFFVLRNYNTVSEKH